MCNMSNMLFTGTQNEFANHNYINFFFKKWHVEQQGVWDFMNVENIPKTI